MQYEVQLYLTATKVVEADSEDEAIEVAIATLNLIEVELDDADVWELDPIDGEEEEGVKGEWKTIG